jgi:hypothetical protein
LHCSGQDSIPAFPLVFIEVASILYRVFSLVFGFTGGHPDRPTPPPQLAALSAATLTPIALYQLHASDKHLADPVAWVDLCPAQMVGIHGYPVIFSDPLHFPCRYEALYFPFAKVKMTQAPALMVQVHAQKAFVFLLADYANPVD